jgi:hypothetical protein
VSCAALVLALVAAALPLAGCAAIGLTGAAMGAGAFSAGAREAVQAGREYTRTGVVYRTFTVPLAELRTMVGDTLARMEIAVLQDELDEDGDRRILAQARDREIALELQPITRTVTRLKLVVAESFFRKDRATASEIVAQTERTVAERGLTRAVPGTGASFLAPAGLR